MRIKITAVIVPILAGLFFLQSCVPLILAGGAAAGAVSYINGDLKVTDKVSMNRAWSASQRALQDMEYRIVKSEKDATNAVLEAEAVKNKRVAVNLKSIDRNQTEISIRVDVFGDEEMSNRILQEIRARY